MSKHVFKSTPSEKEKYEISKWVEQVLSGRCGSSDILHCAAADVAMVTSTSFTIGFNSISQVQGVFTRRYPLISSGLFAFSSEMIALCPSASLRYPRKMYDVIAPLLEVRSLDLISGDVSPHAHCMIDILVEKPTARLHRLDDLLGLCYPQLRGSGSTDCITGCSALNSKFF